MVVVIQKPWLPRERLLKFLHELVKDPSASANVVKKQDALLKAAIEGLIALRYGEVQEIFAQGAKKKSWYGTKPYTLWKLEMQALGFGDLLKTKKYKIDDNAAIRAVAEAYGLKANRYRGWRKRLAKTDDRLMKSFRDKIAQMDWDQAKADEELKKAGSDYMSQNKLAHTKKA